MITATIPDCMSTKFAHITPDMNVVEATGRLVKNEMIGGPVVNSAGILQGWLSEQECLQVAIEVVYHNQSIANVGDIMRQDVLYVNQNQDPLELARQMLHQKPKTYPVVDSSHKVVGVITRRHILCMLDAKLAEVTKFVPAV